MVLYQAITTYHILELIIHRMQRHPEEKAVIILPNFITEKFPYYKRLHTLGFFDEIIIFNYNEVRYFSEDVAISDVERIYKGLIKYNINDFSDIYVSGAQFGFPLYLIKNNIPFHFFEEASGVLTNPTALKNGVKKSNALQDEIAEKYGLYIGDNNLIIDRYCNFSAQSKGFSHENAIDFNVVKEIGQLSNEDRARLMSFFNVPSDVSYKPHSALILTQHFANLCLLSFEEQALIYQLTADYCLEGYHLVFKPHPDDIMFYDLLFANCQIIKGVFPSEFLPYLSSQQAEAIVSVSSTGIRNIGQYYKHIINFNVEYESSFLCTHGYYAYLLFLHQMQSQKFNSYCIGTNEIQMKNLQNFSMHQTNINIEFLQDLKINTERNIVFIDSLHQNNLVREDIEEFINNLNEDDIMIFTNTDGDFCFYTYDNRSILFNIIPKKIRKSVYKEDFYDSEHEHYLYFFTKNSKYRDMVMKFQYQKNLQNTGEVVSMESLTDEQVKIAALEGILEATEKRLLYYINREKDLMEELKELKGDSKSEYSDDC